MTVMLGFFGIGQKARNVTLEVIFICERIVMFVIPAIFKPFAFVRFILVVVLTFNLSPVFAKTVDSPSAIEAITAVPRDEQTEIFNGDLQSTKPIFQKGVDVVGPRGGIGVNGTKLGQDGRAKSGGSDSYAAFTRNAIANVPNNTSNQNSAEGSIGVGEQINHGIWIGLVLALWIFADDGVPKPNAKLTGASDSAKRPVER